MRQKIANYPGVTVEKHLGVFRHDDAVLQLIDLPGTFALSAHSMDERIAVDVALGRMQGMDRPDGVLAVIDATHLYQSLSLLLQIMEMGLPVLVALTMNDAAEASGISVDVSELESQLGGIRVCPIVAPTGRGLNALREALVALPGTAKAQPQSYWPELDEAIAELENGLSNIPRIEISRAVIEGEGDLFTAVATALGEDGGKRILAVREKLRSDKPLLARDAQQRYAWVRQLLTAVQRSSPATSLTGIFSGNWLNQPIPGTIGLFVVMAVVFQAVFAWATPLMDFIDAGASGLGALVSSILPAGALSSFVADGIIAGVGSVIIFLPQILILFLFIILLEDSGFLARSAYLMDRAMRSVGLSGQSIIPMISSFACAVPGIMASRVIPDRRDRIATIIAAPFMTCSARLPVYALLISAFVPEQSVGIFNLQGLILMGLYLLGIVAGMVTALVLKKTALRGPKPAFALMLPEFRRPNLNTVLMQLWGRVKIFLRRAGTVIFTVAVIVWALAYYPRSNDVQASLLLQQTAAELEYTGEALETELHRMGNRAAAQQLEQSYLGRAGKLIEPLFRPLGWDWRVSAAVIAGFPAREVVVAVLGTVYAVGAEADEATLAERLQSARHADGSAVYTLPMVIGLLIFYACCLQCAATLAVIRRETNGWRWPIFAWLYMTSLGYFGALLVYQLGTA